MVRWRESQSLTSSLTSERWSNRLSVRRTYSTQTFSVASSRSAVQAPEIGSCANDGSGVMETPVRLSQSSSQSQLSAFFSSTCEASYTPETWNTLRRAIFAVSPVAVPEKDLPVILPPVKDYEPDGSGKGVLARETDWVNVACPVCGGPAERETDTMDGYACSSWYFLRYADPHNTERAWDPAIANYWLPVDYYCGGDHAVSHLLYSRFWFHFFADQGLIEKTRREPVGKLVYNGYILAPDGTKMSKSKGNTINPDDLIEQGYGADSVRLFEMFIAPYEQNTSWNTNGVPGTYRFLQRVWTLVQEYLATEGSTTDSPELERLVHKTIKRVTADLENLSFNTAVAALMECVNDLYKLKAADNYAATEWQWALESLVQLIAPFAPHIAEELWQQLGGEGSVHVSNWPVFDDAKLVEDTVTLAVQVNGKLRGTIVAPADSDETSVVELAGADEKIAAYLDGKQVVKTIFVPGKLLSFVVK